MDRFIEKIFKRKTVIFGKLSDFGFHQENNLYIYRTPVADGLMTLTVFIDQDGKVRTEVSDNETLDNFSLFLVDDAVGSFVGGIRSEYEAILCKIADQCFEKQVFKSDYAKKLIAYVRDTYSDELEYLWEKFPDNAIWRRKDTCKWYCSIMQVSKRKLGLNSDDIIEVIDVKVNPDKAAEYIKKQGYFKGYHMNKRHWITVCLDGSVAFEEICQRLNESYALAGRGNKKNG